jgi:hypothetical protein
VYVNAGGPDFPFEKYGPATELGPRPWHYTPIPKKGGFPFRPPGPAFMDDGANDENACRFDIELVSFNIFFLLFQFFAFD